MKTKSIRILSLLLCMVMIFGLAACSKDATVESGSYNAGKYTATAKGNNGDVKVEVEFDEKSIVSVKVLEHTETEGLSDAPIENIPQEVVEGQTLAVDAISGATNTSNAILTAIEDCVKQAGGDVDALKNAVADAKDKEDVELTTDVVVVGAGGTGLSAAASAHENGAEVIVLEKLSAVGGSTALSGGSIGATDTRFQQEQGIEDSAESWMELWKERQSVSNPDSKYPDYDRVQHFIDEAVVTTHWLVDYVGHEYSGLGAFGVDTVDRNHQSENGGAGLIKNIEDFVRGEGVEILTETTATELLTDDNGDVIGVVAEGKNGKVTVNAKKVILATGGFAQSEELIEEYLPQFSDYIDVSAATIGATGDGIMMAEDLGAVLYEDPWVIGLGISSRVPELAAIDWDYSKILVNENGERFVNEFSHYAIVTNEAVKQEQSYMIIDSSEANANHVTNLEAALSSDEIAKGETIEELAEEMGVSADTLVKTIDTFNQGVEKGEDELGKQKELLVSVENGPYYALKVYPRTMGTFGGVTTDESFRVLKEDGSVINNLYAGGECSNRNYYNQVYMTGSAVQLALTSGRLVGEHAALNLE